MLTITSFNQLVKITLLCQVNRVGKKLWVFKVFLNRFFSVVNSAYRFGEKLHVFLFFGPNLGTLSVG